MPATDSPTRAFGALVKETRLARGLTQEDLADAARITRQTVIKYERGEATEPAPAEVARVCRALDLDPREIVIALGYATRDEMQLPPKPPTLDPLVAEVQGYLADEMLPEPVRDQLRKAVKAALVLWAEMLGIAKPPPKRRTR